MRWKTIAESFFANAKPSAEDDIRIVCTIKFLCFSQLFSCFLFATFCIGFHTLNGFAFISRFALDSQLHVLGLATGVRVGVN